MRTFRWLVALLCWLLGVPLVFVIHKLLSDMFQFAWHATMNDPWQASTGRFVQFFRVYYWNGTLPVLMVSLLVLAGLVALLVWSLKRRSLS